MTEVILKQPLPWQQTLWSGWMDLLAAGRLPHAVLITGIPGLGKSHLALALAQAVLCQSQDGFKPCGKCKSCRLLLAESHPDLRKVEPEEAGKAVKIDQIRELMDFLSATAQQGGWKCVIIDPADAMNSNAANALLKSLEEPPPDTLIILVTAAPSRLMATLRSRCRQLALAPPAREEALQWLQPRVGSAAAALLDFTHGAPCAALRAFENNSLETRQELLGQLLALAQGRGAALAAAKFLQALEGSTGVDQLLSLLNLLARSAQGHSSEGLGADWQPVIARIKPQLLFRYRDKLLQAKALLLSGANPNKQLLWEELIFDWQALTSLRAAPRAPRALL